MRQKLFIVRKYIYANSASQAIKRDKETPVDDVWWDDEDKKMFNEQVNGIGYGS